MNVAVTEDAAVRLTVQVVAVPVQPPLHPVRLEPGAGDAVSVTELPTSKAPTQAAPHEMPAGVDVTVPEPVPAFATVSSAALRVKVAVTVVAVVTSTTQAPVPVQPPLQPAKVELWSAAALNVMRSPWKSCVEQVGPHEMPAGTDVTVPPPVPLRMTLNAYCARSKFAATLVAAETLTVQGAVPVQPPPVQPVKVEPMAAVAVSVTVEPAS